MPVTAKLSRKFYEMFGDEIANELVGWFNTVDATYKADLHALNEINFQRFEAKLGERIAELRADLRTEFQRELAETKASLLRWMFGFWVGTLAPLAGLVIYLTGR